MEAQNYYYSNIHCKWNEDKVYCSTPFHSLLTSDIKTCTCNVVLPTCTCNYEKILCCDHSNESSFCSSSLIRGVKGGGVSSWVQEQQFCISWVTKQIIVTFSRFSKIEVVQHVKNITLVPFCNTECFDYISRVLRTNKFPREASCMWVWVHWSVKLHQKTQSEV